MQRFYRLGVSIVMQMTKSENRLNMKAAKHWMTLPCVSNGVVNSQHNYPSGKMKTSVNSTTIARLGL